jgi:hypothetical protein
MSNKRDYDAAPVADRLNLEKIIVDLAGDLEELRAGRIGVQDALARGILAKQIFNGVRLHLNGMKLLSGHAALIERKDANV